MHWWSRLYSGSVSVRQCWWWLKCRHTLNNFIDVWDYSIKSINSDLKWKVLHIGDSVSYSISICAFLNFWDFNYLWLEHWGNAWWRGEWMYITYFSNRCIIGVHHHHSPHAAWEQWSVWLKIKLTICLCATGPM